jgi:hypothetical protein
MKKKFFNPNPNEKRVCVLRNIEIISVGVLTLSLLAGAVTAATCNANSTNAVFIPDNGALLGVSYNPAESE